METEKIVGKWACSELFDIQLSIFSSQECYLSVYDWEKSIAQCAMFLHRVWKQRTVFSYVRTI